MGITARVRNVARAKREYRRLVRGGQIPHLFVFYDNGEMVAAVKEPQADRQYMPVPTTGNLRAQVRWARESFAAEKWLIFFD